MQRLYHFTSVIGDPRNYISIYTSFRISMLAGRQVFTQVRCSSGKLKELGIRLRSIRNIEKITKTMKMISSAKFAKVYNQCTLVETCMIFLDFQKTWTGSCLWRWRSVYHCCKLLLLKREL